MENISFMSASDIHRKIMARDLSPVEVMDYFIDRIERRNRSINALVDVDFEGACLQAKKAEQKLMAGEAQGAFFGIPTAAKDFTPVLPGWKGSCGGIPAVKDIIDVCHSTYTKSMIDAGAIFVGKTNSPSLAFRGTCDNKLYGATSTPFKVGFNSGGSSGGSPTDSCPLPKVPMAEDPYAFPPPGAALWDTSRPSALFRTRRVPTALERAIPSASTARKRARSRMPPVRLRR